MHAMLSNDYKRKLCCMAAGAPAAFQSENTRVRPPIIDVFHVRSSSTARHTKCNSRQTRRGSASPQSAHTSSYHYYNNTTVEFSGDCRIRWSPCVSCTRCWRRKICSLQSGWSEPACLKSVLLSPTNSTGSSSRLSSPTNRLTLRLFHLLSS